MLFDQVCELPVARLRRAPHSRLGVIAGSLQQWLAARWQWFRPRTVPVVVAFIGMLGVLHAVNYLSTAPAGHVSLEAVDTGAGTLMYIDGQPTRDGTPIAELPPSGPHLRLVLPP